MIPVIKRTLELVFGRYSYDENCQHDEKYFKQILMVVLLDMQSLYLVSSPERDSRDSRLSRLAEATQKTLGTNALLNWFVYIYLVLSVHLSNIYKIFFFK